MTGLPHLRLLEPAPGILAWYDGRVPGYRWTEAENWVDSGAISVGVASYAIVEGDEALVYDTHVSPAHAARVRADLEALGVRRFTVVLSHWHLDHVAGTAVFADSPVIANVRTDRALRDRQAAIEGGTLWGAPPIAPLVLPTETFDGQRRIRIGGREVVLVTLNIHSDDATVIWLPETRTLLAGDTIEDPVTFVSQPEQFAAHLADLGRMAALGPLRILPAHGDPARIAAGGFGPGIIGVAERYTRWLMTLKGRDDAVIPPLAEMIADDLATGTVVWCEGYEEVHAENAARAIRGSGRGEP